MLRSSGINPRNAGAAAAAGAAAEGGRRGRLRSLLSLFLAEGTRFTTSSCGRRGKIRKKKEKKKNGPMIYRAREAENGPGKGDPWAQDCSPDESVWIAPAQIGPGLIMGRARPSPAISRGDHEPSPGLTSSSRGKTGFTGVNA